MYQCIHYMYIPLIHYNMFYCRVVREQQFNKMSYNNLALVFGPTLIRPKPEQIA